MTTLIASSKSEDLHVSRLSWGAIIAGTATALTLMFVLNLLGAGIGLVSIDPMTEANTMDGMGTGALIWLIASNLAAMFVGGAVAARMAGLPAMADGGLHGFLVWATSLLVSLGLFGMILGGAVSGVSSLMGELFDDDRQEIVVNNMANQRSESETSIDSVLSQVRNQAIDMVEVAEQYNVLPSDASEEMVAGMRDMRQDASRALKNLDLKQNIDAFINDIEVDIDRNGDIDIRVAGEGDYINRDEFTEYLSNNTQLSEAEINGFINRWDRRIDQTVQQAEALYAEAKAEAVEMTEEATDAAGTMSILAFIVLLLSALAAFFGGATGTPTLTVDEERDRAARHA